jgi:hypothetical protein
MTNERPDDDTSDAAMRRADDRADRAMTPSGPAGLEPPDEPVDPAAAEDELTRDDAGANVLANVEPVGPATASGGGYGVGSDEGGGAWLGTGGASEPDTPGETPTQWFRTEETGAPETERRE